MNNDIYKQAINDTKITAFLCHKLKGELDKMSGNRFDNQFDCPTHAQLVELHDNAPTEQHREALQGMISAIIGVTFYY